MYGWIRTIFMLTLVVIVTTPLALAQIVSLRTAWFDERRLPRVWHRFVLWVLDFRLTIHGEIAPSRPLMLVANHVSWTDTHVTGAAADIHFVAKSEVSGWPMIGTLAKLQRTIFVERDKKRMSGRQVDEIAARMKSGDPMLFFAEGQTSDGNLMLPFKTSLFGAATVAVEEGEADVVTIQPVAIVYSRLHGMPMQRQHRGHAAWIGDRLLLPHIVALLSEGAIDVELHFGTPIEFRRGDNRKEMAREIERRVREMVAGELRDTRRRI